MARRAVLIGVVALGLVAGLFAQALGGDSTDQSGPVETGNAAAPEQAFSLPTPEPTTTALLLIGGLALLGFRRRKS